MISELIKGILICEFDDILGPNPKLWLPDLPENIRMLVSIKTITLLTGEENVLPKNLVIIPFPSINLKGMIKYIQWDDETRRGGVGTSSIVLLFKEENDVIYYKYKNDLEVLFDEAAQKIGDLEAAKSDNKEILPVMETLQADIIKLLEEMRKRELVVRDDAEAFPVKEEEPKLLYDYRFKVIVVGDPSVGKTSTVLRFTDNAFQRKYMPTIGVNISEKVVRIGEKNILLVLWDIAGQAKFDQMRTHFYKGIEGLFLVFDLTRENTFKSISKWYQDIKKSIGTTMFKVTGFILGNKNDLTDERKINEEEAQKLSKDFNLKYFETSALTGENVEEAFHEITKTILRLKTVLKLKRF